MSPGPDFAVVTKNCIKGTFRAGVLTALGVSSALLIHVTYCVLGIALVIQQWPPLFLSIKYLGAGYLLYLGFLCLKEKASPEGQAKESDLQLTKKHQPFVSGFLCNLLNPKATLFVLSLFTQFIKPEMSFIEKSGLGLTVCLVGFIWFVFLSYLITHRLLQKHFARFQLIITKAMGIALCFLAVYVAFFS